LDILRWLFILLLVLFWMSSFMEQDVKEAESLFCLTLIDFLASFVCLLLVTVSMHTLSYDTAMTLLKITGGILIVWPFILLGLYAGICIRILRKYRNRRIQAKNAV
jgi:ABC-type transport system involved in cytochrome bd biosynthesis fused ATPase/permease subunit